MAAFDAARVARWRPDAFDARAAALPTIGPGDARPILPGLDLWDCWPLEHPDGTVARYRGRDWWFFLSSARFPDPGQRHDEARIRLVSRDGDDWRDHGPALPDGYNPGSREWAGSAVLWEDGASVSLYFTAAGRADQPHSFEQRLFEARGRLGDDMIADWAPPFEIVRSDGVRYVAARELIGRPGAIKAFRDPAFFRDPVTGLDHILFAGSAGWDDDPYNGVVGIATRRGDGWQLGDPLVEAVGVDNELERPHVRVFGGRYYLFFSTQTRTFAPDGPRGPNGLYALTAPSFAGPWRPVNGSGLIAANPAGEPTQGYSWWVDGAGDVASFIDHWGLAGRDFEAHPALLRDQFGGTPGPFFTLDFAGDRVTVRR